MVVVGSRGTNGAIRGFEKSSGRNTAQATPANGGGTSGTIVLKNGVVIFTNTGEYGYGIMVPDDQFVWSPVPTADTFAPGKTLRPAAASPASAPTTASTFRARSRRAAAVRGTSPASTARI